MSSSRALSTRWTPRMVMSAAGLRPIPDVAAMTEISQRLATFATNDVALLLLAPAAVAFQIYNGRSFPA